MQLTEKEVGEKLIEALRQSAAGQSQNRLLEANRKLDERLATKLQEKEYAMIKRAYGVDMSKIDFLDPYFDWPKFKESAEELSYGRLREVNAASTFGQLFRTGAQTIMNDWYMKTDVTYKSWMQEVPSNKRQEWYPPMYKSSPPRRVNVGEKFKEQKVAGQDIVMVNYKAGGILSFEQELMDDDQTGQISRKISEGGENMAVMEEAWAYARFIGAATTYGDDPIPASQTKPSYEANWPWSTALQGGGVNRPATYHIFRATELKLAWQALYTQLDGLGFKMLVRPNTILCSRVDYFDVATILNSAYWPSVPSGTALATGTNFATNVLKGLANPITSRFMPDYAWALGESGKGMIFQRRDALELVMEAPNAGLSFEQDEIRGRSRSRWETDWIVPHFWFLYNDGTVTS